ncbi:MAG: hypothetical protein ACTS7E_05000 [Arsenophonus sp. NC-CH8-MAG3]
MTSLLGVNGLWIAILADFYVTVLVTVNTLCLLKDYLAQNKHFY